MVWVDDGLEDRDRAGVAGRRGSDGTAGGVQRGEVGQRGRQLGVRVSEQRLLDRERAIVELTRLTRPRRDGAGSQRGC